MGITFYIHEAAEQTSVPLNCAGVVDFVLFAAALMRLVNAGEELRLHGSTGGQHEIGASSAT